jgi:histidinol dehydrogenase
MKRYRCNTLTQEEYRRLLVRGEVFGSDATDAVRAICDGVRHKGDEALREYTARFDGRLVGEIRVSQEIIENAWVNLADDLRRALVTAAENIRAFHHNQGRHEGRVETTPGVVCWREVRPLERVGLYVPAGSAPLPSTVLMLGIPAVLAGCDRIILCSPPRDSGEVDPLVLAAAHLVGLHEVYRVGGAQAIAAMAYGTESIPRVDKIFGPGNRYVAAAKQLVASDPDGASIDLLAGPSELLVIADGAANPRAIAADLLSQAEHDPDSQVVLVTDSPALADAVDQALEPLMASLSRRSVIEQSLAKSYTILTESLDESIRFSNDYAPEHLIVNTADAEGLLPHIRNAGSVFLGPWSPITAGDYASGTNHTLPTGGTARREGGVSLESFQRMMSVQSITRDGLDRLAPTLTTLAEAEGLDAHAQAVRLRKEMP